MVTPGELPDEPGISCLGVYQRCMATAAAVAVVEHLACISVDWTGIGALVCHSAVAIIQFTSGQVCGEEFESCKRREAE